MVMAKVEMGEEPSILHSRPTDPTDPRIDVPRNAEPHDRFDIDSPTPYPTPNTSSPSLESHPSDANPRPPSPPPTTLTSASNPTQQDQTSPRKPLRL